MYCSKCGNKIEDGSEFCPKCREKQNNTSSKAGEELTALSKEKNAKLPIILLSIGAGLSLLIFLISWMGYGKVYFFNGYTITMIGWIVSFVLIALGIIFAITGLVKSNKKTNIKRQIIAVVSLVAVLPMVLVCSAIINGEKESSGYSSYMSSPESIQNAFESCHSTAEHKQAIYSYDIDNDNYLSEYELELFFDAHPRLVNDKPFMNWLESMSD